MNKTVGTWQEQLWDLLRQNEVEIFGYVPDAGHKHLINQAIADPKVHDVSLTNEMEGIGLCCGVGNTINLLSLVKLGNFPFLTLVTMRGNFGEGNPWQFPMGQGTQAALEAMGVICLPVWTEEDVIPTVEAALTMAFKSGNAVAVLLTQRLIGAKEF